MKTETVHRLPGAGMKKRPHADKLRAGAKEFRQPRTRKPRSSAMMGCGVQRKDSIWIH